MKHLGRNLYFGILLIVVGIFFNKWAIELLFLPDGDIESISTNIVIALIQLSAISTGLYIIFWRPSVSYGDLALASLSLLLAIVSVEIGLRIWLNNFASVEQKRTYKFPNEFPASELRYSRHPYLNYYLTPNYRDGLTAHNSLGYRGREIILPKPADVFRIVALGGSTTYTASVDDNQKTFTRQLEKALNNQYGHQSVEVINAGVMGYNSWESLINLQFRVLDLDPDLIIVYHGTNDVHTRLVAPQAYKGDNTGRRKQWTQPPIPLLFKYSFFLRIAAIKLNMFGPRKLAAVGEYTNATTYQGHPLKKNLRSDPMELLDKNPPIFFKRNLISMAAIARAHNIDVILSSWAHTPHIGDYASRPDYRRGFKEGNAIVREVADEMGVRFFDFAEHMPKDKKYWADGRHVNERGALAKARLFAAFIDKTGLLDSDHQASQALSYPANQR